MLSLLKLYFFSRNFTPCRHFWSVMFMSCNFLSCNFMPCNFDGPSFLRPAFSVNPERHWIWPTPCSFKRYYPDQFPIFPNTIILLTITIKPTEKASVTLQHCETLCALLFCAVTDNTLRDVAKRKPSVQVSTYSDQHLAGYANDGNEETCAKSEPETNPWWAVDLEGPTLVFMVKLTNRKDGKGIWHWILLITSLNSLIGVLFNYCSQLCFLAISYILLSSHCGGY